MFKNKIKKYFTTEILKSFIFILTVLSLLVWTMQAAKYLYLITDMGISTGIYLRYIFYLLPKTISQLINISFLITIFLVIIKFQQNKEIEIYWLSGVDKKEIANLIFFISILIAIFSLILHIVVAPFSSGKSRALIAKSELTILNSLVKKNNFNSPLKGLTIYVHKNDLKGNLEKIYIFEKNKTIISKKGTIINSNGKNYLELSNGSIHEKNNRNNITTVTFDKTLYDFTKFTINIINTPKLQERNFNSIVNEYNLEKKNNVLYEIHKRLFKPLLIPIIGILSCFILYVNKDKFNPLKIKFITFSSIIILIILQEVLINAGSSNIFFRYFLYCFPLGATILSYVMLSKFLTSESR